MPNALDWKPSHLFNAVPAGHAALKLLTGACLLSGLAQAQSVSAPSWSTQALASAQGVTDARVASEGNGAVMAVWAASDGTASSIYAARLSASGTWDAATLLESSNLPADSPRIAGDGAGNFMAVWRQAWKTANGTLYGLFARRYAAATGWDSTTSTLYLDTSRGDVTANGDPVISMNADGVAGVTWSVYDWSWNHNSVRATRYTPTGGWKHTTNLSTESVQSADGGTVAVDTQGNLLALWSQSSGTTQSTQGVMAARFDATSGWGTPMRIESASVASNRPGSGAQLGFDAEGNALAVWYQYSKPGIYSNRYSASSGWGTPQAVADPGTPTYDEGVTLAVHSSGKAVAVWNQYGGVLYGNTYTPGQGWASTTVLESNRIDYSARVVLDANANALAVWTNYSCNAYNIQSSRFVDVSGWSSVPLCYDANPQFVNNAVRDYASAPQLVMDASSGRASAVWLQRGALYGAIASAYTAPVTPADCIFNWAQNRYPDHFGSNAVAGTALDYQYRYYPTSKAYLALAARDNHLYYWGPLSPGALLDLGRLTDFQTLTGCF